MSRQLQQYRTIPLGIVVRKTPGVTRWARWNWRATDVMPGAGDADWRELRREGDAVEYHAATRMLELHGAETEAYLHELGTEVPSVYVVMRTSHGDPGVEVVLVTASPYEAQDYCDNGEDIVERVPMPASLAVFVHDFLTEFHEEEVFVKRRRDKKRIDLTQDGIGDPRIGKDADIYASPALKRKRLQ